MRLLALLLLAGCTLARAEGGGIVQVLRVYTAHDSHFDPEIAAGMHQFLTATEGNARLAAFGRYRQDKGTQFSSQGGVSVWGPLIQEFVR